MAHFIGPLEPVSDRVRSETIQDNQIVCYEMTLFLYDFGTLDSSILFLGLIHCEYLLVKDYFLIVELDGIRYRYWVIYD